MNDKNLSENLILLEKGVADLFFHGALESGTANVHQTFSSALNDALRMQNLLYSKMSAKGWYPAEQAEQTKVTALKQKFSGQ